jgi:hypothetical protein
MGSGERRFYPWWGTPYEATHQRHEVQNVVADITVEGLGSEVHLRIQLPACRILSIYRRPEFFTSDYKPVTY